MKIFAIVALFAAAAESHAQGDTAVARAYAERVVTQADSAYVAMFVMSSIDESEFHLAFMDLDLHKPMRPLPLSMDSVRQLATLRQKDMKTWLVKFDAVDPPKSFEASHKSMLQSIETAVAETDSLDLAAGSCSEALKLQRAPAIVPRICAPPFNRAMERIDGAIKAYVDARERIAGRLEGLGTRLSKLPDRDAELVVARPSRP